MDWLPYCGGPFNDPNCRRDIYWRIAASTDLMKLAGDLSVSDTQMADATAAVIDRGDYGFSIPSVSSVANVEEEVELSICFLVKAAE
jgi:hypothetical protein